MKNRDERKPKTIDKLKARRAWQNAIYRKYPVITKIFHPHHPIFTLTTGIGFLSAGLLGLLKMSSAMFFAMIIMTEDIINVPVMQFIGYLRNVQMGRKRLKSFLGIFVILLGYVLGACCGYYFLAASAPVLGVVPLFIKAMNTSLTLYAILAMSAFMLAKLVRQDPFTGLMVMAFFISIAPMPVVFTAATDVTLAAALIGCLAITLLYKNTMRLLYKLVYGHSNADGYYMDGFKEEEIAADRRQAKVFRVRPEVFKQLRVSVVRLIKQIHRQSPLYTKLTGSMRRETNAYKDIYHRLMTQKSDDTIDEVRSMLHSDHFTEKNTYPHFALRRQKISTAYSKLYGHQFTMEKLWATSGAQYEFYEPNELGMQTKDEMHRLHCWLGAIKCFWGDEESRAAQVAYHSAVTLFKTQLAEADLYPFGSIAQNSSLVQSEDDDDPVDDSVTLISK